MLRWPIWLFSLKKSRQDQHLLRYVYRKFCGTSIYYWKVDIFQCYFYQYVLAFSENDFVGLCFVCLYNITPKLAFSILCWNSLYLLILSFAENFCQKFFFKSQVIAKNKFDIGKCEDFVWVTKDELMEYFPEQAEFFNKMIISWWQVFN